MAFVEDSFGLPVTMSGVELYLVPAGKVARITMIQIANVDGTNDADITVYWTNSSNADAATHLCKSAPVAALDALSVQVGGLILAAGDKIFAVASADGDLEATVSFQEEDI
jgi:hypothetical protein